MLTATKLPANDVANRRKWRRQTPRATAKVECRRGTMGLGPNLALELLDISECGIGIIIKIGLKVQEDVEILVRDYGQSKTIKQLAKVCWCLKLQDGRFCAGMSFEKWLAYADVQMISKP